MEYFLKDFLWILCLYGEGEEEDRATREPEGGGALGGQPELRRAGLRWGQYSAHVNDGGRVEKLTAALGFKRRSIKERFKIEAHVSADYTN